MARDDRPPPLEDLDARLKAARAQQPQTQEDNKEVRKTGEVAPALRVGTDLVAGVAVGAFIGWALDRWLGTQPWFMIVFFILGAAAGFYNIYRSTRLSTGATSVDNSNGGEQPPDGTKKE